MPRGKRYTARCANGFPNFWRDEPARTACLSPRTENLSAITQCSTRSGAAIRRSAPAFGARWNPERAAFRQEHESGRLGLSDFADTIVLGITAPGCPKRARRRFPQDQSGGREGDTGRSCAQAAAGLPRGALPMCRGGLSAMGVEVITRTAVTACDAQGVSLSNAMRIDSNAWCGQPA
jgi:hypothetical protein